jgi:putative membrane protein
VNSDKVKQNRLQLVAVYGLAVVAMILNLFEKTRPAVAAVTPFMMVVVGLLAAFLTYQPRMRTAAALALVTGLFFVCDALALSAGFPFGDLVFTRMPGPRVMDVPLVIPFASLALLIPAWVASDRLLQYKHIVVASIVVTAADGVMEFAADSLDLWHWRGGMPSELNAISWFGISYLAFFILSKFAAEKESHPIVPHFLFAQLLYFASTDFVLRFVLPLH